MKAKITACGWLNIAVQLPMGLSAACGWASFCAHGTSGQGMDLMGILIHPENYRLFAQSLFIVGAVFWIPALYTHGRRMPVSCFLLTGLALLPLLAMV
jgi:hypothetical protein